MLLKLAEQDELVLLKLLDDRDIDDSVLGFHLQQAVEKRLKAVLSFHGVAFAWSHNIAYLTELLSRSGITPPVCRGTIERLTPWASRARYDDLVGGDFDRDAAFPLVIAVQQWSIGAMGLTDSLSWVAAILKSLATHADLDHLVLVIDREQETGVIHVTLDGSAWAGSTTALGLALLVAELDYESGTRMDTSVVVPVEELVPGLRLELTMMIAAVAKHFMSVHHGREALIVGRCEDFSFVWAHLTAQSVVYASEPPDTLSKLLLLADDAARSPVDGGTFFDKPDPDVRFSAGTIELTDDALEMLEQHRQTFREKFGREPGPDDPVWFDPTADDPQPMTEEQIDRLWAIYEESGGSDVAKRVAAEHVLSGRFHSVREKVRDASREYPGGNPLPLILVLSEAASLDGGLEERCLYAIAHAWAEGHLAASGHPEPGDADEPLNAPPFPDPDDPGGQLRAVLTDTLSRFQGGEEIEAIAYAASLAWRQGRLEGHQCSGCAIENGTHAIARALRRGELRVSFVPEIDAV
jgi:hypothetical protein